jgi:hypothetical protein
MEWFRWHNDTIEDKKWRAVARRTGAPVASVVAVWAALCENANQSPERGTLANWDAEAVAAALDLDTEQVNAITAAMQGRALDGDRLTGWEKRNPKREDSTAAERKKRERSRKVSRNVTHVTPLEVEVEKETDTDATTIIEMRARAGADRERDAGRIIVAANAGMKANPALPNAKPIPPGHGSRQTVLDWLTDGIPPDFAALEVEGRARDYRPGSPGDQIHSMNYFDKPVREAWRNDQTGVSDGTDDRGTGKEARGAKPSRFDGHVIDGGSGVAA